MIPQTTAEWQRQMDSLAWLRRQFAKTWPNTTHQLEVGDRAAPVTGSEATPSCETTATGATR